MTEEFDVIVRGPRVIDPGTDTDVVADVGIRAGRIAAVGPQLIGSAKQTVWAEGLMATPGLVDLHTHVFAEGSYWGIHPDRIAALSGVTTWIDAGSAGAYTVAAMERLCRTYLVEVRAFLHISGIGLAGCAGESVVVANLDAGAAEQAVRRHSDFICGIKVRIDRNAVGPNGLHPLRMAIDVGERVGLPVMAHVGPAPPTAAAVADLLRPGDVLTHCWSARADWRRHPGADPAESRRVEVRRAAERGIVLDIGHGSSSFAFSVAEELSSAGMWPHVISTDLHVNSIHGPVWDLPTTMGKLASLGMPLIDVIRATTHTPARVAGLTDGRGTLAVGAVADMALFALEYERHETVDSGGEVRSHGTGLRNVVTFIAGREQDR